MVDALAARSDAVAQRLEQGDGCAARAEAEALHAETIAAVNAGRIPARYQEELTSSTASLAASIDCAPPAPPAVANDDEDEDEDEDDEDDGEEEKRKGKKDKHEEDD